MSRASLQQVKLGLEARPLNAHEPSSPGQDSAPGGKAGPGCAGRLGWEDSAGPRGRRLRTQSWLCHKLTLGSSSFKVSTGRSVGASHSSGLHL